MAVILNARGTSIPFFTIGKGGTTLYQGSIDPYPIYSIKDGDIWIDKSTYSIKIWQEIPGSPSTAGWVAPHLNDIIFDGNTITSSEGNDLRLQPYIGNDLYLHINKWPYNDGTSGQILTTDGSGNLSWQTQNITVSLTTSTTDANQVVDSVSASLYRTIKYITQITSGSDYQSSEILITHNGTASSLTEYAKLKTGDSYIATFDSAIVSGNIQLRVTPSNSSSVVKVTRIAIPV